MEITIKEGNILDGGDNVIAHQVSCDGIMDNEMGNAIKTKFPRVFAEYLEFCNKERKKDEELLGEVQLVEIPIHNLLIANLFGQKTFSLEPDTMSTSYDAIHDSMCKMRDELLQKEGITTIGFPYGMSSVSAGADWNVMYEMIKSVFKDTDFKITIWKLN